MNIVLLCAAIMVIVFILLAFNVSMMRIKTGVGVGTDERPSGLLTKSIRAHGNAAEYIPLFVALFLYLNATGASGWIAWVVIAITVCRVLHPIGIYMSTDLNRPQVFRFVGAIGTYLGGLLLGAVLLIRAW